MTIIQSARNKKFAIPGTGLSWRLNKDELAGGLTSLEDFGEFLYFKVSTVDARRNHEQNFAAGEDKAVHL